VSTIVTTAQQDRGRVRIDLDWTSLFSSGVQVPKCLVYRVPVGGTPALIREGNPCVLSNLKATIYDWEGPLDTPTYYQAVTALNPNGDFEDTVEGWTGSPIGLSNGGTATRSTDYFYAGSASLQWTPDGTTASPTLLSDPFFAVVGTSYTVNAQLLAAKTWAGGVGLIINWYTGGGAFISQSGSASDLWPAVGLWEAYTLTATAPATAVFGRIGFLFTGKPSKDRVFYVDEAYVYTAGGTIDSSSTPVTLSSAQGGWWKDPLHPATMVRLQDSLSWASCGMHGVALIGVSRPSRPADAQELPIPNQAIGVGSFSTRKSARRTISVAAGSFADADAVRDVHASGSPLLLQLAAKYGIPDGQYWLCGDLASSAVGGDMTRPLQVLQVDMAHNQMPPGPAEGVAGVRYADLRVKGAKLTYAAAISAGYTWLDALKGNIS
jgi:hypothetical protein